ncbi:hypothetical protein [Streptomyces sp. CMB-StM0423]|uniref:hypothetical protein n=1 Tax=Streptomyces sp. CMB-StM0423 TaxID=2059884 RepID=UPI000C700339|nr:hypothetical protein [Streptomyces sp. CMB-StM0423]AUH42030.1 hypothetical protein CXR04_19075 [Streptomyces sp. CMB-StM0423]
MDTRTLQAQPERNGAVALVRRGWSLLPVVGEFPFPVPYHSDFTADGKRAFSVTKKLSLYDRYEIDIADPALDRRLIIAQAVALDALQSR